MIGTTIANPTTIVLQSGGGLSIGALDTDNTFSRNGGTFASNAVVTSLANNWGLISGTQWINYKSNNVDPADTTIYRTTFTLPNNFNQASISTQILADNKASISINGNLVGATPASDIASNYAGPVLSFTDNSQAHFHAGVNTLDFTVTNLDGPNSNPAGLDYKAIVSYGGFWQLPAIALTTGSHTVTATETLSGLTSTLSTPDTFTVVTSGNTIGKVTGGGGVGDSKFAFVAKSKDGKSFSGNLEFKDKPNKITLKSDSITSLSVDPTGKTATFSGTGTVGDKSGYVFKVSIADNGEPGKNDVFSITIFDSKGNQIDSVSGILTLGNIQIHTDGNSSDADDQHDFKDCQKLEN